MQIIKEFLIFESSAEVAEEVCDDILHHAEQAIAERGCFKLVLAGGSTPEQVYRLLAKKPAAWEHWYIYHGDERCLPADHADRNSVMAANALLDHVAIPPEQIFTMPTELGTEQAKLAYQAVIADRLPFDMVLLGMGEDGHTASLFPGHVHNDEESVHAVYNSPKPPPERITLSAKTLSSTRRLLFIITGASKRAAVKQWQGGEILPVTTINPESGVTVYFDKDALG
jgi:6-phosphogluconolactonase